MLGLSKNSSKENENQERLTSEEWGEIYNPESIKPIAEGLKRGELNFQSKEMLKLSCENEKVLEIGCGTGGTSCCLALNGRIVTALDYSKNALLCAEGVAKEMGVSINTVFADAMKELPFAENEFDVAFQAGLLEHFEKEERISLLKNWGRNVRIGGRMVSIIPNAASIAYRTGKAMMEQKGTWRYGLELPQYSLQGEFASAGFCVLKEYTIGAEHALNFLPEKFWLRKAMARWLKENPTGDDCGQGYLLVTVGEKQY